MKDTAKSFWATIISLYLVILLSLLISKNLIIYTGTTSDIIKVSIDSIKILISGLIITIGGIAIYHFVINLTAKLLNHTKNK